MTKAKPEAVPPERLTLRTAKEPVTIQTVAADHEYLQGLYQSSVTPEGSTDNTATLKKSLVSVVDSARGTRDIIERNSHIKRRYIGLILTILSTEDVDADLATDSIEYILRTGFSVHGSVEHIYRKKVIAAASLNAGVLYHFLEEEKRLNQTNSLVSTFRWCINLRRMRAAKNLLYVIAEMPKCTLAKIISSSFHRGLLPIAFAMIEMGVFCYHKNCTLDERPKEKNFDSLISEIKAQPLSLKQMSRLVIRGNMQDVDVVKGSYTLPIPTVLQDYVSLRFLDATITSKYFPNVTPMQVDLARVVNRRYGTSLQISKSPYDEEKPWQWRLDDDYNEVLS